MAKLNNLRIVNTNCTYGNDVLNICDINNDCNFMNPQNCHLIVKETKRYVTKNENQYEIISANHFKNNNEMMIDNNDEIETDYVRQINPSYPTKYLLSMIQTVDKLCPIFFVFFLFLFLLHFFF